MSTAESLSHRLSHLASLPAGQTLTLGELILRFGERAHAFMAFLLVMPFLQPVPLPFVSTPFGLAAGLMGLQMARQKPPWLPRRLAERPMSTDALGRIAHAAARWASRFEHLIRPRGRFMHDHPVMQRVAGGLILLSGLLLSLPLPVPISNFLPAFTIALLALGNLEEDGLVILLGYVAFTVTCVFFTALGLLPLLGIDLAEKLAGLVH